MISQAHGGCEFRHTTHASCWDVQLDLWTIVTMSRAAIRVSVPHCRVLPRDREALHQPCRAALAAATAVATGLWPCLAAGVPIPRWDMQISCIGIKAMQALVMAGALVRGAGQLGAARNACWQQR